MMKNTSGIKKVGVFTSGGDAPGMNAAIRGTVRAAHYYGLEVSGIYRGYEGMIEGDFEELGIRSVSKIIARGGTMLKSSRSDAFRTVEGRAQAAKKLKDQGIEGLVAIGGNGTFAGAEVFRREHGIPTIGIPGTIDNDLAGTDYTIGYDTATNVIVDCIDKIRDTASSHNRLFFVEVMGRDSGFLALRAGVATGAIAVMLPEEKRSIDDLIEILERGRKAKKTSSIVIVAEGDENGGAAEVAKKVNEKYTNYDTKVTILGHLQRGGSPSCFDRVLAGQMGVYAVEALMRGESDVFVGAVNDQLKSVPLSVSVEEKYQLDTEMMRMSKILSI